MVHACLLPFCGHGHDVRNGPREAIDVPSDKVSIPGMFVTAITEHLRALRLLISKMDLNKL
jgi:hypothetical protein